ncbi:hypothetical protein SUNI508_00226 [Seiridium unicorne]|uniref:Uncharacterized protein n=1 Tax=Seiridium unicorne TaxID=138068 RepID=A0ABR2VIM3_9PEZI
MPTFVTYEVFACGCTVETGKIVGRDRLVLSEMMPVAFRCLNCIFKSSLASLGDDFLCVPASVLRDLEQHVYRRGSTRFARILALIINSRDQDDVRQALNELKLERSLYFFF